MNNNPNEEPQWNLLTVSLFLLTVMMFALIIFSDCGVSQ